MSFTFTLPPGSTDHEDLFNHIRGSIPTPMRIDREFEDLHAIAAAHTMAMATAREYANQLYIARSERFWLDGHGADRELARQEDETDESYRIRIRQPQLAVTPLAILSVMDDILAANGVLGSAGVIEFPCGGAFLGLAADSPATAAGFAFLYDLADFPDGFGYPLGFLGTVPVSSPGVEVLGVICGAAGFTMILPSGTDDATLRSVEDATAQAKAAGVIFDVIASP